MFRALLSAVRAPPSGSQTTRRLRPHNLSNRNNKWRRWTSTIDDLRRQHLLTLHPERFLSMGQEVFDISNKSNVVLYCQGPSGQQEPIRLVCNTTRTDERFPANTVGLFYGYEKPNEGFRSIRFRLCSSVDDFHQGSDLRRSDGRRWSLPRGNVAALPKQHRPLLHLIKSDYPEDDCWLSLRYPVHSFSPQHIVNKGGQVLDISNKTKISPKLKTGTTPLYYLAHNGRGHFLPFPSDTRGVFYYNQSATAPTAIGELRFRLCDDISLFDAGKDLCLPSGLPWCVSSDTILAAASFEPVREQFFEEGLLSPVAKSFVDDAGLTVLHGLNQPFAVNIETPNMTFVFKTGKETTKRAMRGLLSNMQRPGSLYMGRAVVQFEKYPLEDIGSHARHRPLFTLRFLEFLTPVTKTAHPDSAMVQHPEPGQYLRRRTPAGKYHTWGYSPYDANTQAVFSEWAKQPPSQEWESLQVDSRPHFDAPLSTSKII
ncbi:hypothetical protein D9619_008019 [Psilocybe cf. subviscida]|uniref:Uncharacterized protein n=1 Tax=Psilocybe cf. subviscida TaxID=2480587 RepID=A0A8H5ES98_9AGAR|nr:hypothetical protein D9619_008019 [Psilocybe cf. subviscida]